MNPLTHEVASFEPLLIDPSRSFVLIGNGESVLGRGSGETIDAFDEVVRFNSYKVTGHEADVGRKTTLWASYGRDSKPQDAEQRPSRMIHVHGGRGVIQDYVKQVLPVPHNFFQNLRESLHKLGWLHQRLNEGILPSTGLVTASYLLLECGVPKISVAGFDHFDRVLSKGTHHYWDPKRFGAPPEHDGGLERLVFSMFAAQGRLSYLTGMAPTNFVSLKSKIGKGTSIWHYAIVHDEVHIGEDCSIGSRCEIGAGSFIGDRARISSGVFLAPNTTIGAAVFVGPNTTFTDDRNPVAGNRDYKREPSIVCEGASIGAGCVILPGVRIGFGAMVGAGSVVAKDVPDNTVLRGPRADIERERHPE